MPGMSTALRCGVPLLAALAAGDAGAVPTQYQLWPEFNAFVELGERSRLLFIASSTNETDGDADNDPLGLQEAQFSVNFDYTLEPILRRDVPRADWAKNRLFWMRLGFEYGTSGSSGSDSVRSYTGIGELRSRYATSSASWLNTRLRVDLRDINGERSQRYRARLGAEWEVAFDDHPYAPYTDAEVFYDTRYDKWSRLLLRAGVETPIATDWRIEPYLALQLDRPDDATSRVWALGVTLKVYFD